MLSRKEKIRILKKSIRDYTWSYIPFVEFILHTDSGLCSYFSCNYRFPLSDIPEIWEVFHELHPHRKGFGFWFPQGEIRRRLVILKRALEKIKLQTE